MLGKSLNLSKPISSLAHVYVRVCTHTQTHPIPMSDGAMRVVQMSGKQSSATGNDKTSSMYPPAH